MAKVSPEKQREYSQKYYAKHLEMVKKARNKYQKSDTSRAYHKAYRQTEKFKIGNYGRVWAYRLKKIYGLNLVDYKEMLAVQGNCCAICADQFEDTKMNKKDPCIDHNHLTNKVRGMLCRKCNLLIGYANDSINILEKAISYLKQYEE